MTTVHTKDYLETKYASPDPWGYQTHPDDALRKRLIIGACPVSGSALDIGAGEGWITKGLPAQYIAAIELSDVARKRIPTGIRALDHLPDHMRGSFNLVLLSGVMYEHYLWRDMWRWAWDAVAVGGCVVACNILEHEVIPQTFVDRDYEFVFPYRSKHEHLIRWRAPGT